MPAAKKTLSEKERKVTKKTKQPVQKTETEVEVEVEVTEQPKDTDVKTRVRKVVDKESIMENFDEIIQSIDNEIESLRENTGSKTKPNGVKFLRSLNKQLKQIKVQSGRVMRNRKKTSDKSNGQNSGFLKEVPISKELAAFTGWDEDTLASRVQVTKFLCNYIKDNNLQNPSDRRQINPDKKLTKLLKLDSNSKEPLKYYSIQTYLKPHFK